MRSGDYPIQSWMWGVGATQFSLGGGYPIQSWMGAYPNWGVPHPVLTGVPLSWSWMGTPPPISRMGYPLSRPRMGYPPSRPGMGYTPPTPGWGTPCPDLGWGTPPHMCGQTENITFPHPSDAGGNKSPKNRTAIQQTPLNRSKQRKATQNTNVALLQNLSIPISRHINIKDSTLCSRANEHYAKRRFGM